MGRNLQINEFHFRKFGAVFFWHTVAMVTVSKVDLLLLDRWAVCSSISKNSRRDYIQKKWAGKLWLLYLVLINGHLISTEICHESLPASKKLNPWVQHIEPAPNSKSLDTVAKIISMKATRYFIVGRFAILYSNEMRHRIVNVRFDRWLRNSCPAPCARTFSLMWACLLCIRVLPIIVGLLS